LVFGVGFGEPFGFWSDLLTSSNRVRDPPVVRVGYRDISVVGVGFRVLSVVEVWFSVLSVVGIGFRDLSAVPV